MISRRQFFGRAAVGAVGIAAVPFMLWDKLAKLFAIPKRRIVYDFPPPVMQIINNTEMRAHWKAMARYSISEKA